MLSQIIWWSGIGLEAFLLYRGVRGKLRARYPVFYAYILFVALQSLLRFSIHEWWHGLYGAVYWSTEALGLLLGCWVVFEIYRVALAAYPGTALMARNVLGFLLAMAVAKAIVAVWENRLWTADMSMLQAELALRTFQAVSIAALVSLFFFYAIPFGKNLRGILMGYSVFILGSVICLNFVRPSGHDFWFYAYSGWYLVVLLVWAAHLWAYEACPQPKNSVGLEQQYLAIATATQRKLEETRKYLRRW